MCPKSFRPVLNELGLKSANGRLPAGLDLSKASFFSRFDDVENVITGEYGGRDIAVINYNANHGDVGYKQTTVAIRSENGAASLPSIRISSLWRASEIAYEDLGNWAIFYRKRETVSVPKLAEFVRDCDGMYLHLVSLKQADQHTADVRG